ncbi:PH domain-containing protein [Micavibrio aeruginosavorus]|uniref:PH domain-containing protein n=1 Tax=Micavibrio aeruginosavorus TaxID=349221 RepID=UPI003F4ACE4D
MLYVQQSLNKDEELVYVGHFHWMYNVQAVMAIVWGVVGCIAVIVGGVYVWDNYMGGLDAETYLGKIRELHPAVRLGAFLVFVLSLLRFAQMMVVKATTEIAVTTSRLIFKRGLVARYVGEMSIDRIEGVNVLQTILGRIFNYGRVMVRGMGVGEVILPPIADPIAFRKAIDRAKSL